MKLSANHRTVTQGDWCVSGTTGHGIKGTILHIHRHRCAGHDLRYKSMRGFGDGKQFPDNATAWQWAYDHGYLQLYFTSPELRKSRKERAYSSPSLRQTISSK